MCVFVCCVRQVKMDDIQEEENMMRSVLFGWHACSYLRAVLLMIYIYIFEIPGSL